MINVGSVNNSTIRDASTFVVVTGNLTQIGASAGNNNTQKMILGGIDGR